MGYTHHLKKWVVWPLLQGHVLQHKFGRGNWKWGTGDSGWLFAYVRTSNIMILFHNFSASHKIWLWTLLNLLKVLERSSLHLYMKLSKLSLCHETGLDGCFLLNGYVPTRAVAYWSHLITLNIIFLYYKMGTKTPVCLLHRIF